MPHGACSGAAWHDAVAAWQATGAAWHAGGASVYRLAGGVKAAGLCGKARWAVLHFLHSPWVAAERPWLHILRGAVDAAVLVPEDVYAAACVN